MEAPLLVYDPAPLIEGREALVGLGSFSSPVCSGAPQNAAGMLLRALQSMFGDLGGAFEEDVFRQCEALAESAGVAKVFVQLLQKAPGSLGAGYQESAERPHIDLDPKDPNRPGMRLVRHYYGEGTKWLHPQKEPQTLKVLRNNLPTDLQALQKVFSALMSPLEQVPKDYKLIYKGGLSGGLVHCAPPCVTPRLILVVSVF